MAENGESATQHLAIRDNDEIDLIELFDLLWRSKWVIGAITLLVVVIALAYALMATQKWTSVAYVRAPRVEQIKAYLEQRRVLARITGNGVVDVGALSGKLFNSFLDLGAADLTKQRFFLDSAYYEKLVHGSAATKARYVLDDVVNSLQIRSPGKGDVSPRYTLSFVADSAEDAQSVLTAYVEAVNHQASALVDGEFQNGLNASVLARRAEMADLEFKAKNMRNTHILELQAALATARNAGIKQYAGGRVASGTTVIELRNLNHLFLLGEKYLSSELRTAQESPLIFPPRYYELKRELQLLDPLLNYRSVPSYSYSYLLSPTLPSSRTAPKRALIVILGGILGVMLGCGWVVVSASVRRRDVAAEPSET